MYLILSFLWAKKERGFGSIGFLIPASELEVADIQAIRQKVIDALFSVAMKMTGLSRDQLVVRNTLPSTDLGLTNEVWVTPSLTANSWTNYFTNQLDDQRFVAFYGIANLSSDPIATAVRFKLGSGTGTKTLDVIQFEDLYSDSQRIDGYLKRPIIYKEKQYVNVDVYAKSSGTEPLVLKSLTVEPAGRVTF